MIKAICWLVLTLLSATGIGAWFLQQQYEARSADFRILYREITVKVSQHDAIIPLLPASQNAGEVQRILPQIVQWRRYNALEPRLPIVAESRARYWLNLPGISLLIDLNTSPSVGTLPRYLRKATPRRLPGGVGRKPSPVPRNRC